MQGREMSLPGISMGHRVSPWLRAGRNSRVSRSNMRAGLFIERKSPQAEFGLPQSESGPRAQGCWSLWAESFHTLIRRGRNILAVSRKSEDSQELDDCSPPGLLWSVLELSWCERE